MNLLYALYFVGLAPLFFNLVKDIIDNKAIDALKNAGMNYAAIVVWLGANQNMMLYTFFVFLLMLLFSFKPHALGTGDYTALFWIFPTMYLLSPWALVVFLCLFLFGVAITSRLLKVPFEGYIPLFVAYVVTGLFFIAGLIPAHAVVAGVLI